MRIMWWPLDAILLYFTLTCAAVTIDHSIIERLQSGPTTSPPVGSLGVGVEYTLSGEGYHRELIASLWGEGEGGEEDAQHWKGEREAVLVINVTSDLYVDLDQISQTAEFGGPEVIVSGLIDTEQHSMDAHSHTVLAYFTVQFPRTQVKVPLHLRYQATGSSPYSVTNIPSPHLLLKTNDGKYTIGGGISLPCSPKSPSSLCHWALPSPQSHPALVAMVPVGQNSHVTVVAIVTVSLTISSTLYIVYVITRYRSKEENKIE